MIFFLLEKKNINLKSIIIFLMFLQFQFQIEHENKI
jgi:hypothetical protein